MHNVSSKPKYLSRILFREAIRGVNIIVGAPVTKRSRRQGDYMATSKGIGHEVLFPLANGLRHGQGKRVWANGATYIGRRDNQARLR